MAFAKKAETVELRPGISVDIIVNSDILQEKMDVRGAFVYDIVEVNRIILSQTVPALSRGHLGKDMDVTFVHKQPNGPVRYGVIAKLTDIVEDYQFFSTETLPAVVMIRRPRQDALTYNLRMYHRVKPGPTSGIKFILNNQELPIVDISVGGLCFIHDIGSPLEVGKSVSGQLVLDGNSFPVRTIIVRMWSSPELRKNLEYVAAQFAPDKRLSDVLSGKVLEIERQQLSRGQV